MLRLAACSLGLIAALACAGCSVRLGDMSVLTTKGVSLDGVNLDTLPQRRNIEGEDMPWLILFFPLGIPHLETAVDDALARGDGDVMLDAVITSEGWWFLVGRSGLKVRGTVVQTRGATR
jgi:hypothetical protein